MPWRVERNRCTDTITTLFRDATLGGGFIMQEIRKKKGEKGHEAGGGLILLSFSAGLGFSVLSSCLFFVFSFFIYPMQFPSTLYSFSGYRWISFSSQDRASLVYV